MFGLGNRKWRIVFFPKINDLRKNHRQLLFSVVFVAQVPQSKTVYSPFLRFAATQVPTQAN